MLKYNDIGKLAMDLRDSCVRTVGIDGFEGAGKTYLSSKLTQLLGYKKIDLDDVLNEHMGGYVEHIRHKELHGMITEFHGQLIVCGCCLLGILGKIKVRCDTIIYVKRMSHYGMWHDEELACDDLDIDDCVVNAQNIVARRINAGMACGGTPPLKGSYREELVEELVKYHHEHKPHKCADIEFSWVARD